MAFSRTGGCVWPHADHVREACRTGDLDWLQECFPEGPPPESLVGDGEHALLHRVAGTPHVRLLRWLLSFGPDVETRDEAHRTPLWVAVESRHLDMVACLLKHGHAFPNPSLRPRRGRRETTLLHVLCFDMQKGSFHEALGLETLLEGLLRAGADPDVLDRKGERPDEKLSYRVPYPAWQALADRVRARFREARDAAGDRGCGLK